MEAPDASTLAQAVLGRFVAGGEPVSRPFVLGISGLQGSGKSTLAAALVREARQRGWGAVALSLDDVYLTRAEREALGTDIHPLLRTRGVPGTHDLALLGTTLDALAMASPENPVPVPRFDKGHDDRHDPHLWPVEAEIPRLVILEGWCLGLQPESDDALTYPINALERDEDADGRWRHWVNAQLAGYAAIWRRLDALVVLQAPSWDVVAAWRDEAERPLRERGEPRAMDHAALAHFLQHYERLSRHALATLGARVDWVIPLDRHRRTPDL